MKAIIHELKKAISKDKYREELEEKIAENIKEAASIPELYTLGLDVMSEILDKCDIIDSDSISNIINYMYTEYGEKALVLLPHIKCEKLCGLDKTDKLSKIENILTCMDIIPIIQEVTLVIQELITKGRDDGNRCEDDNYEEGGFDVDWKNEYKEIKAKYELMEKKISIAKQLRIRNENEEKKEREYTMEKKNEIERIVKAKDLNRAIEVLSKDPSLIYGDFLNKCDLTGWKEGVDLALDICLISDDVVNKKSNDFYKMKVLIWAISRGYLEIVKYLIEKGANIEAKDDCGKTALIIANECGQLEVIKYLIEKGANIEAKDDHGRTALIIASDRRQLEIVKYLIEKGANIEAKDDRERTALIIASECRQLEIVKYLIEKGANIEAKDDSRETALTCASFQGQLEIVKILIEKGANIEAKDDHGRTALIIASNRRQLEIVKYLIEKGANIEAKDIMGMTALMCASFQGQLEIVKYLIEKGANIEAKGIMGKTALIIASNRRQLEIVKYLIEKGAKR